MSESPSSDNSSADGRAASAATADATLIDTNEFCRRGQELGGTVPVARLLRLSTDLFDDSGEVQWLLRGRQIPDDEGGQQRRLWLRVDVQAAVRCDRCLQRLPVAYQTERDYLLLRNEREAAAADADVDEYDVLVGDARFDVMSLVEDEAIMAQPLQAEHERCDLPAELPPEPAEERPNPFAALAKLKSRPGE